MIPNVGNLDRMLRAVAGAVLLYLAFASGLPLFESGLAKIAATAVGAAMLGVAALRVCPLYTVLGFSTRRRA